MIARAGISRPAALFLLANILFGAGLFFHAFLYNFYLDRLGMSPVVLGNAAAALTFGGLVTLLPAGWVVDRIGARGGLVIAGAVCALGLAAGAFVAAPWPVYAAAAVAGAGGAFWRVTQAPTLLALSQPETRARLFALNVALIIGSGAVGMAIAGATPRWIEQLFSVDPLTALRLALALGAACTAVSLVLFASLRLPRADVPVADQPAAAVEPVVAPAAHVRVLLTVGLIGAWMLGPALGAPFFNLYFFRQFTLPVERVGTIFALASGTWALSVFVSGELTRRFGLPRMVTAWLALYGPAVVLLAAGGLPLALACFVLQGMAQPCANPLIDQVLMERSAPERRGSVSSWRNIAADLSAMTGASAGGRILASGSFPVLFGVAAAVGVLATPPLVIALRRLYADGQPSGRA